MGDTRKACSWAVYVPSGCRSTWHVPDVSVRSQNSSKAEQSGSSVSADLPKLQTELSAQTPMCSKQLQSAQPFSWFVVLTVAEPTQQASLRKLPKSKYNSFGAYPQPVDIIVQALEGAFIVSIIRVRSNFREMSSH